MRISDWSSDVCSSDLLLPLIAIVLFVVQGNAQDIFVKGDKVLNLSVGVGSSLYSGSAYGSVTPALADSFEVGVVDDLFDENSALGVGDRKRVVSGKSVSVRVDLGGCRLIKKKT